LQVSLRNHKLSYQYNHNQLKINKNQNKKWEVAQENSTFHKALDITMEIWAEQYQFLHKNTKAYRVRNTQALTLTKTSHIKMLQLEAIFTIISTAPKPVEHELQYRVKCPITMSFEFSTD
jgi:hypothetical protein